MIEKFDSSSCGNLTIASEVIIGVIFLPGADLSPTTGTGCHRLWGNALLGQDICP